MVDFKLIAEKIQRIALRRGYAVEKEALETALQTDERRLRSYKHVFSTQEGRWVLMDLMVEGGLLSSFEEDNSLKLAHLEGKRSMAVRIASSLGLDFEQVIQMYSDVGKEEI